MARHGKCTSAGMFASANLALAVVLMHFVGGVHGEGWAAATTGRFPFVVTVKQGQRQCSGVIIGPSHVLTSARCVTAEGPQVTVEISSSGAVDHHSQVLAVEYTTTHPRWSPSGGCAFGVAVLRLERNANVQPPVLAASAHETFVSHTVHVYQQENVLQVASVLVVAPNSEDCKRMGVSGKGDFCVWKETEHITPGSTGGPVIFQDLSPEFKTETGCPEMDMLVGILCDVEELDNGEGSVGCVVEISGLSGWIRSTMQADEAIAEHMSHTCRIGG